FLDIYVSTVTDHQPAGSTKLFFPNGRNQLFINNRNGTFTEQAKEYGLDLKGYNTQAVFFDYDRDGDLDMFQLQHSTHQTDTYRDTAMRRVFSKVSGGKLYRNDSMHYSDVTKNAGIYSSVLGYGLGIIVTDFNNDGWEDMYVGNDFHENDYYYVNQGNGTFMEMNAEAFGHTSNFSMGNDAADINNDGWQDLVTLDMLPEDEKVLKSSSGDESFDTYSHQRSLGYGYQYSRNALQLNTGRGMQFSEQALLSGISATDWSWSALFNDYDLDGIQDLFVSNGIRRRLNDLDYIKFLSTESLQPSDKELMAKQPDGAWHNYLFQGTDSLKFHDRSMDWGFEAKQVSNGAIYADLDNDGDEDLVTNNMNAAAGVYRNNSREINPSNNYLQVKLKGPVSNLEAIGAKMIVYVKAKKYFKEVQTVRGFMSSVDLVQTMGLGKDSLVDSIMVIWPDQRISTVSGVHANQRVTIDHSSAVVGEAARFPWDKDAGFHFTDITTGSGIMFKHRENLSYVDFNRQLLIPHELSTAGPAIATGDINNDGLDDIYFGGAKRQPGELYLQNKDGSFRRISQPVIEADSAAEDVDALFFDANNDGFQDLYVVSGGNEYFGNMPQLADRLYLNDRAGHFYKQALPTMFENKSCVAGADYDRDGDIDLFVGGRADSKAYGRMPRSFLLENDGKGNFTDVTKQRAPDLQRAGMVTAAAWIDINKDGSPELLIAGEWMAPMIFQYGNGTFTRRNDSLLNRLTGLWSCIKVTDIDHDGDQDILLGNYGLNNKFTASEEYPLKMYVGDIDKNQTVDQLIAVNRSGRYYPFLSKEVLEKQLPYLKKTFLSYEKMAGLPFDEVFPDLPEGTTELQVSTLESILLINNGSGGFGKRALPREVQLAPVFDFFTGDLNGDRLPDLVAGGNFYGVTPYEGRYDGLLLSPFPGNRTGGFDRQVYEPVTNSIRGETRKILSLEAGGKSALLVGRNNNTPVLLQY
ncbi:MAG TPA: VCBS repeat-containing protein, partial [Flavitalea sp.]|nr:VCBS repeat-containing protein [Flavitalea sp.]